MTLYQSLFSISISICDRFHMNPFKLNKQKAVEVIYLINDITDYNLRQNKEPETKQGKRIIERPAGDDWF